MLVSPKMSVTPLIQSCSGVPIINHGVSLVCCPLCHILSPVLNRISIPRSLVEITHGRTTFYAYGSSTWVNNSYDENFYIFCMMVPYHIIYSISTQTKICNQANYENMSISMK